MEKDPSSLVLLLSVQRQRRDKGGLFLVKYHTAIEKQGAISGWWAPVCVVAGGEHGTTGAPQPVRRRETDEVTVTSERPQIILTDTSGELLEVDVLAYPEDTYLVVDPYATVEDPGTSMENLVARAESTLPRPLGEITAAPARGMGARWLVRLVLLDFHRRWPCRAKIVEETLKQLIWQGTRLGARYLGLDRFELLEACISAYRVLSCLCHEVMKVKAGGGSPPIKLIFSIQQPSALRHYQMALANLPPNAAGSGSGLPPI
ncbi:MAG: hypothetical protein ACLFVT_03920 [Syntrophobacteria bacterium]